MKISSRKATDSLYIHLADCASVEFNEVKDGVVLDFDANGNRKNVLRQNPHRSSH
jgi:hypothetical protein